MQYYDVEITLPTSIFQNATKNWFDHYDILNRIIPVSLFIIKCIPDGIPESDKTSNISISFYYNISLLYNPTVFNYMYLFLTIILFVFKKLDASMISI